MGTNIFVILMLVNLGSLLALENHGLDVLPQPIMTILGATGKNTKDPDVRSFFCTINVKYDMYYQF